GNHTVLNNLNFTVQKGERVTLIGPSGSGKTTILRLLMTLEHLTGGYIYVDGAPLTHTKQGGKRVALRDREVAKTRKRIGMVFQQFNLFPNMSVIENITEAPIHVLGQPKEKARQNAQRLLDQVGLGDRGDAHPTQLSGGQQQRVAIARALARNPEILLLDEVTSALDPEAVGEVVEVLRWPVGKTKSPEFLLLDEVTSALDPELVGDVLEVLRELARNTNITMLIVTHEMQFARDVSHRVMMFDGGQIIEEAEPDVMFTNPSNERTK